MNIRQEIVTYQPYNEQERTDKARMLEYMDTYQDLLTRENKLAHFTVSAWIANQDLTKVVMAHHNIYNSWAWVGGHVDGDSDFLQVALREANEETGLESVKALSKNIYALEILDVPAHEKRGEKIVSHLHLNITYLLQADERETFVIKSDENSALKWVERDTAPALSTEPFMKPIYQKLNDKLRMLR